MLFFQLSRAGGVLERNVRHERFFLRVLFAALATELRAGDALILLVAQLVPSILILFLLAYRAKVSPLLLTRLFPALTT